MAKKIYYCLACCPHLTIVHFQLFKLHTLIYIYMHKFSFLSLKKPVCVFTARAA